jgi:hypothetical protein
MLKKRQLTDKGITMGLDQYAYIASKADSSWNDDTRQDLAYWRKHPNLQGWMEKLFINKGGECDTFNGVELELTWDDIDKLEKDIKSGQVSELDTKGFFFGNPSDDYYREHDLDFCVNAKAELFLGRKVFYNSSW